MTRKNSDIDRVLIDEATIQQRVCELAHQVSEDYAEEDEVLLVGILKGAFIFLADLARQLQVRHAVDFMALSSYGLSGAASGAVRIIMDLRQPVEGKHVLLVEDIVDTGLTLDYLNKTLESRRPASLRSCVLLDKAARREVDVPIDYLGFEIPDVWVVGYGLDYADQHRTLPYIGVLRREVVSFDHQDR
ncbi:MAG: Hypoxanthine phosphoribosyltransferase [Anaerolineales bacterium]|nr:Hypoxanthine phosphoribosyltransferase [Anaerolineales bacterium]